MKYPYEDLSPDQFENLIVLICHQILGIGTLGFAPGRDGGRDARFEGTAQLHPSTNTPWVGKVIVQAKHTNGFNKHFGEADFYSADSASSILAKEIPRIKRLKEAGELDHYMLFANRKLIGDADSEIRKAISIAATIPTGSITLIGVEQLELYLKTFDQVAVLANLDPIDSPLIVSSDEIAEVVSALAIHMPTLSAAVLDAPVDRVSYVDKNRDNSMSVDYAKMLRHRYLKDSGQIRAFLAAPENTELLDRYNLATDELEAKIVSHRHEYQSFDRVMDYLGDLLLARDPILRQVKHKRLTKSILFYMYWNCDIGVTDADIEANEALSS